MAKRKKKHEKLEGFTDWTAQDGEILTWSYLLKMAEKASDVDSPMMIRPVRNSHTGWWRIRHL